MAISPDVVSFIHRHFGCCDLLWRSGIRNVARKASSVSPTTGMVATPSRKAEALARPPVPGRGFSFCAASVGGLIGTVLF